MSNAPTLATLAAAIAQSTPREPIQALLRALMPERPVATRPPILVDVGEPLEAPAERQPRKFQASGRKRRAVARIQHYELTGLPDVSRRQTFRRYMLTEIIFAHTEVSAARTAHALSDLYPDQVINFTWAEKQGYIRFV